MLWYVRDEREVGDGHLTADEPLLLGQHAVEDAEHALDLVLVALLRARDLLVVEEREPGSLAKVWALARRLEEQPLQLLVLVLAGNRYLILRVVLVDDVLDDRVRFPIDRCGSARGMAQDETEVAHQSV